MTRDELEDKRFDELRLVILAALVEHDKKCRPPLSVVETAAALAGVINALNGHFKPELGLRHAARGLRKAFGGEA